MCAYVSCTWLDAHKHVLVCAHICRHVSVCACISVCFIPPGSLPFASWAHLGHALSMTARVWVWSSQHFVLPLSGLITLCFKCYSHVCITQITGPLLSLDLGLMTLCGTWPYYLMHRSAVLSCHDACVHEDKIQFEIWNLWDIGQVDTNWVR